MRLLKLALATNSADGDSKKAGTRVSVDASVLSAELLRCFVQGACRVRASPGLWARLTCAMQRHLRARPSMHGWRRPAVLGQRGMETRRGSRGRWM